MSMNIKYQIFISSTFKDLVDWRKGIIDQIFDAGHIPSGMEGFHAGDQEDLKVIKRAIDLCDIYVVMIGAKFGSRVPGRDHSFTQLEFDYAMEQRKPILAFVLDNDDFNRERDALEGKDGENAVHAELVKFREHVKEMEDAKQHRIIGYFSRDDGIQGLKVKFMTSLSNLIHSPDFNMPGWVRLPSGVGTNPFFKKILKEISRFDTLSLRCTGAEPSQKIALAQHFWSEYWARIAVAKIHNIFIESGSTLAYVAAEFRNKLAEPSGRVQRESFRIRTNNILPYLDFILSEHIQIELTPHGPPEDKYGATFGTLHQVAAWPAPTINEALSSFDEPASIAVRKLSKEILRRDSPGLILTTASGLETSDHPDFPGPHVGTFHNKLVKQALLLTKHPLMMFLDESKISPFGKNGAFEVGECHQVCDPDITWDQAIESFPIAMCIGSATKERLDEIIETFVSDKRWFAGLAKEYPTGWAVIIKNRIFDEQWGKPVKT